jgi:hypothetical protein
MEIKQGEDCVVWEKTRNFGKEWDYDMSVNCPMVGVCERTKCVYLATPSSKKLTPELKSLRRELQQIIAKNKT